MICNNLATFILSTWGLTQVFLKQLFPTRLGRLIDLSECTADSAPGDRGDEVVESAEHVDAGGQEVTQKPPRTCFQGEADSEKPKLQLFI